MLVDIKRFSDIDTTALIAVYSQTIHQNAYKFHRNHADHERSILAEEQFIDDLRDFFQLPNAKVFLWQIDDRCVSALRSEPYLNGVLITHLETAPDMRGRGYAKKLLASVIQYLQKLGVRKIYSHVGKQNAPSIAVHRSNGFYVQKDCATLLDGTVSQNFYTLQYNSTAEQYDMHPKS